MLEEVVEMIAILKATQKHYRELEVLRSRANVMCPSLMRDAYQGQNYRTILDVANIQYINSVQFNLERQLSVLATRKKELEAQGEA